MIDTPDTQPRSDGSVAHHTRPVGVRVRSNITGSLATTYPGVLIDWRRNPRAVGGWEGYVIWAEGGGTTSVTVRQEWRSVSFLEKV